MTRHVDLLVAEVQYENSMRLLEPDVIPKERRYRKRRRPNTALIAEACKRKAAARGEHYCWDVDCPRCKPA